MDQTSRPSEVASVQDASEIAAEKEHHCAQNVVGLQQNHSALQARGLWLFLMFGLRKISEGVYSIKIIILAFSQLGISSLLLPLSDI